MVKNPTYTVVHLCCLKSRCCENHLSCTESDTGSECEACPAALHLSVRYLGRHQGLWRVRDHQGKQGGVPVSIHPCAEILLIRTTLLQLCVPQKCLSESGLWAAAALCDANEFVCMLLNQHENCLLATSYSTVIWHLRGKYRPQVMLTSCSPLCITLCCCKFMFSKLKHCSSFPANSK